MPTHTLADIVSAAPALQKLAQLDVPIKVAAKIKKIVRASKGPLEDFNQLLNALQSKHFKKNEKDEYVRPLGPDGKPDPTQVILLDPAKFTADLKELREQTVELSYDTIPIADLGDVKVAGAVLADLHWLIIE